MIKGTSKRAQTLATRVLAEITDDFNNLRALWYAEQRLAHHFDRLIKARKAKPRSKP